MTMARVSAAQRKHIQQQKLKARHARMRQAKKTGKADIPMEVLQKLASLNLPPNPWVYSVCLDALMRGM
jgi:aminoglycoside phosphotransferase (APT) family kinase protein